jgi:hypothetical protein
MRANILLLFYLYIALAPLPLRDELARLPGLIAHFQLHRLDDPEQGFISFLLQHYGQEFASHQAEHDHSELPGKSHPAHDCACTAAMAQIVPANDIPALRPPLETADAAQFLADNLLPSTLPDNIWQPPRKA